MKILVIRFSSLGDIVMATAMVRCLKKRFAHASIDMVVREDFLDLIKDNPHLNRKIAFPRKAGFRGLKSLAQDLNQTGYDLVYDAHRSLRSFLLLGWIRSPRKIRWEKKRLRRNLALIFKFPKLKDKSRMLERFVSPLNTLGVKYDGGPPELFVSQKEIHNQKEKLPGLKPGGNWIGFVPSARWSGKRWPVERYREVIEHLMEHTAHGVLVFGDLSDSQSLKLCDGLPVSRVVDFQGKTSLSDAMALLSSCAAVVANDTGLMHMADALSVPTVVILGPTSGELGCLPYQERSQVIEQTLWCRPCSKNGEAPCLRGRRVCLERTEAPTVIEKLSELLRGAPTHECL